MARYRDARHRLEMCDTVVVCQRSWSSLPAAPALLRGPVAVSVGASEWPMYMSGVFDGCTKEDT
eukprot:5952176-Amphidinium_carterae.1